MKYHVKVDGEQVEIEIAERANGLVLVTEAGDVPIDLTPIRGGSSYSLLIGDGSLPVVVAGPNDDLTLTLGSETWHAQVQDEREAIAAAAAGDGAGGGGAGLVRSQMPGIVREVRVVAGDQVKKGDALVILEAMKMQNEIRAAGDGEVTAVHIEAGTAVAKGDSLVTLG